MSLILRQLLGRFLAGKPDFFEIPGIMAQTPQEVNRGFAYIFSHGRNSCPLRSSRQARRNQRTYPRP